MVINSSINFLIYCAGSQQFKDEFFDMFWPKCLDGLRRRFAPSEAQQEAAETEAEANHTVALTVVTKTQVGECNEQANGHQGMLLGIA